jgi:hypothetical protein
MKIHKIIPNLTGIKNTTRPTSASRRLETCSGTSPAIPQYKPSGNPWIG